MSTPTAEMTTESCSTFYRTTTWNITHLPFQIGIKQLTRATVQPNQDLANDLYCYRTKLLYFIVVALRKKYTSSSFNFVSFCYWCYCCLYSMINLSTFLRSFCKVVYRLFFTNMCRYNSEPVAVLVREIAVSVHYIPTFGLLRCR